MSVPTAHCAISKGSRVISTKTAAGSGLRVAWQDVFCCSEGGNLASLNDPGLVRREYASEGGLLGRRAAYEYAEGPDAPDMVFEAVAEARPRHVLDVGCGPGELAERIGRELGAKVRAIDISPRMVELARERGVDARVADVEHIPFGTESFDCVVAAWMLYHVPAVDRALGEMARVLKAGGRLVAVTNYRDHLIEARALIGVARPDGGDFPGEEAPELLRRHFQEVESRDASGAFRFPDRNALEPYLRSWAGPSRDPRQSRTARSFRWSSAVGPSSWSPERRNREAVLHQDVRSAGRRD